MTLIERARWAMVSALPLALVLSCGEPAGRSAPFREATGADPSPPKAGEPIAVLPSLVVSGEVRPFKAAPPDAGAAKSRGAAGSLPSTVATGSSRPYVPAR